MEPVVVGELCLALQDDCYYRAEVVSVSLDHDCVNVFRLYDGRSLPVAVDTLWPLTVCGEEPGLVVRAGLAGLVPTGKGKLGAARVLLDVEGDTRFEAEV